MNGYAGTAATGSELSTSGSWGVVVLTKDGTQMSSVELTSWMHLVDEGKAVKDLPIPHSVALVRSSCLNLTLDEGKDRTRLDLQQMGADLVYSAMLGGTDAEFDLACIRRTEEIADRISR